MNSIAKNQRQLFTVFHKSEIVTGKKNRAAGLKLIKVHSCSCTAELDVS